MFNISMSIIKSNAFYRNCGVFRRASSRIIVIPARVHAVRFFLSVIALLAISLPLSAQTELGSEDDLTVLGTNGTDIDPDAEIKGFTVFGSTQAAYPGGVAGPGNVVVNGALAVSSGAYFAGVSTFSAGMYVMAAASFTDVANIYITGGADNQVLAKNGLNGPLKWTNTSALGDNLGDHIATQDLSLAGFNVINASSITAAAARDGLTISTNAFVTGKLGVGTSDPRVKLDVTGNELRLGPVPYPAVYSVTNSAYLVLDKSGTAGDTSVVFRDQGNARAEIGIVGDNDLHFKTVTGSYGAETFTDRVLMRATGETDAFGLLRSYATSGVSRIFAGNSDGAAAGAALELSYDFGSALSRITSIERGNVYRDLLIEGNNLRFQAGAAGLAEAMRITAAGNVGISSAAPGYRLVVSSGAGEAGTIFAVSTGTTNLFWVAGDGAHAIKYYGDGSELSGLASAGDNLGTHVATKTLDMAMFPVVNVSSIAMVGDGLRIATSVYAGASGIFISNTGAIMTIGKGSDLYAPAARGLGAVELQTARDKAAEAATGDYSVISGGGYNTAGGNFSAVGGGQVNYAGAYGSVIGGGEGNSATGATAVVAGGLQNIAGGIMASVGGGQDNRAAGFASSVAGGYANTAKGDYSWAGGRSSSSTVSGAFTWTDSQGVEVDNSVADRTVFKNRGGFMLTGNTGVLPDNQGMLDVVSTGTASDIYAQVWRDGTGVVVASMTSTGTLYATLPAGVGGDNLGDHTATKALEMAGNPINNVSSLTITGLDAQAASLWVATSAVTPHLYVSTTGYVGLGTAGPADILHIKKGLANVVFSAAAYGGGPGTAYAPNMTFSGTSGLGPSAWDGSTRFYYTGLGFSLSHNATVASGPNMGPAGLGLATGGRDNDLFIDASGNIGIGSTTPAYRLVVSSGAGETGTVMAVSTGTTDLFWVAGDGAHAMKFIGDGSGLTGLIGAADNLGNHVATTTLNMAGNAMVNVSSISASGVYISAYGVVQTSGPGLNGVPGDVRGNGAVDLQAYRVNAAQVASGDYSAVTGGASNAASASYAVVAGGALNASTQLAAVVSGGMSNTASANYSAVSGGNNNTAGGLYSMAAGGSGNKAQGDYSFAAGNAATSTAAGAFTWADSQGVGVDNKVSDRVWFKARGGFLITGSTGAALSGASDRGVFVAGNGLVGISTGAPYAALDVVSTGTTNNEYAQIWRDSGGVIKASMTANGVLYATMPPGSGDNLGNHTASQDLNMSGRDIVAVSTISVSSITTAGAGVTVSTNLFVMNGKLGIGITSPASPLDVRGTGIDGNMLPAYYPPVSTPINARLSGGAKGGVVITAPNQTVNSGKATLYIASDDTVVTDDGGSIAFGGKGDSGNGRNFALIAGRFVANSSPYPTYLQFALPSDVTNNTSMREVMRINSYGAIGIGTTTPLAALNVVSTGSAANQLVQVWGNTTGAIVSSMSATGVMTAVKFVGDGSGITGIVGAADNLGNHTAIQNLNMNGFSVTNATSAYITAGGLGGAAGNSQTLANLSFTDSNTDNLAFLSTRTATGATWASAGIMLKRRVDATDMGYIRFGSSAADPLTFGLNQTELMRLDSNGNLGIGNPAPNQKLTVAGNISQTGVLISSGTGTNYFAGNIGIGVANAAAKLHISNASALPTDIVFMVSSGAAAGQELFYVRGNGFTYSRGGVTYAGDLAELYNLDGEAEAGDVMMLGAAAGSGPSVARASRGGAVLGIVATQPGVIIGHGDLGEKGRKVPVALSGRVPVKISLENGPVRAGTMLSASDVPGRAAAAARSGVVIGMALEDFDPAKGDKVLCFVNRQYWVAPGEFDSLRSEIETLRKELRRKR